jgi:putative transposase
MESVTQSGSGENFEGVIRIEEGKIRSHVDQVVRETVEQTLNGLLQAEADDLCGAKRYARSPERLDTRAGHYDRKLHTKAGEVTLQVPRLRNLPFETEIIERYRRRGSSVEEALVEMYLAGVSVRRVEDITEALWGTRVSPSTVSELNQKIYVQIDAWRNRPPLLSCQCAGFDASSCFPESFERRLSIDSRQTVPKQPETYDFRPKE